MSIKKFTDKEMQYGAQIEYCDFTYNEIDNWRRDNGSDGYP